MRDRIKRVLFQFLSSARFFFLAFPGGQGSEFRFECDTKEFS
jgi:hypothetical protein